MARRLVIAAFAALCATSAAPAHAAAPVELYLNQTGECAGTGPVWTIDKTPGGSDCVFIPREQVNGEGVTSENEAFSTGKKMKTYKLDVSKPLTGTFALFGSSGTSISELPAVVAADLVIKVAKQKVGTVHIEGQSIPTKPVTQTFSFKLPASLKNVKTNSVQVNVTWITCVGMCGVKVAGPSFMDIPVK